MLEIVIKIMYTIRRSYNNLEIHYYKVQSINIIKYITQ